MKLSKNFRRKVITVLSSVALIPAVMADNGIMDITGMMGYGMKGGYSFSAGLFGLVYFALITLVFSMIFWGTYNWIVKGKKKSKK